jgi:hypothetical protein
MKKELLKDIIQWDVKSWSIALSFWDRAVDWNKIQKVLNWVEAEEVFHFGWH